MRDGKQCRRWVCVYDSWDGSPLVEVDSEQVAFCDLPDDGILGFQKIFADGTTHNVTGYDWYFFAPHPDGSFVLSGFNGMPNETSRRYPGCCLKRGKWTTDERIHASNKILFG